MVRAHEYLYCKINYRFLDLNISYFNLASSFNKMWKVTRKNITDPITFRNKGFLFQT